MQIKEVQTKISDYNDARGWNNLPEDIAKSIMIEAAELLEHFQWDAQFRDDPTLLKKDKEEIGNEAIDILWYLMSFFEKMEA